MSNYTYKNIRFNIETLYDDKIYCKIYCSKCHFVCIGETDSYAEEHLATTHANDIAASHVNREHPSSAE